MTYDRRKICIVGTGGFGREVLCCLIDSIGATDIPRGELVCFMVDDDFFKESIIMGVPVIRRSEFDPELYNVVVAVGDPLQRKKLVEGLPINTTYATIIHPTAVVSEWVKIGKGSIITAGVILTCNIELGEHAHLNLHTTVGHDCKMGNYFTTAPGTNISGSCKFEDCVYFGTNASVRQGVTICSNVTIGMGGVVVKDITEPGVYVGNPLKKLEQK